MVQNQTPDQTAASQQQAIATLRAVTAVPTDADARALLEAASWDLDRAATAFLDAPPPRTGWLFALFSPLRFLWSVLSSLTNRLLRLLAGPAALIDASPGDTPHARFLSFYESRHGASHPPFFPASYHDAVVAANADLKFLLVYIHSESHRLTRRFCADVLAHPAFVSAAEPFIFWAGSVTQREAAAAHNALRAPSLPFLAVVAAPPRTSHDLSRASFGTVLALRAGAAALSGGGDAAAAWLARVLQRHAPLLDAARRQRDERESARRLRRQQDAEYAAALEADRRADAAVRAQREREEGERRRVEELERRRERKRAALQDEPLKGPGVASVVLRLPDGSRVGRRFNREDVLEMVFDWAEVNRVDIEVACLVVSFPRRRFLYPEDASLTVGEAGLFPSCMLLLEEREE